MKKEDRQKIFDKYGGKCAYCGCDLQKGWHVDELEPCRRNYRTEPARYELPKGLDKKASGWKYIPQKTILVGYEHPERLTLDNQMPSCASCNINKHSNSLEWFRSAIAGYMKHLNEISTQYKISKRYGLVTETGKPVVFYFEKINQ